MAKKSKTQKAKASAARAAKKEARETEASVAENATAAVETAAEAPKKKLFNKAAEAVDSADKQATKAVQKAAKAEKSVSKADKKPAKQRFSFLKDVRAELKRVTWPSREDVLRWSLVVVVALLFFGIYVAILDNAIITPLLIAISGLGA